MQIFGTVRRMDCACGEVHKALADQKNGAVLKPSGDFLLGKYCK